MLEGQNATSVLWVGVEPLDKRQPECRALWFYPSNVRSCNGRAGRLGIVVQV